MLRLWTVVLGMEIVAVVAAVLTFGPLVLLVGVPLVLVTVLVSGVVRLSEAARLRRIERAALAEQARASDPERTVVIAPPQRGLMSGFFELPKRIDAQGGPARRR